MKGILILACISLILCTVVKAQQPNCLNQITKFDTLTFKLQEESTGIVQFKNRSCPSNTWTETFYKEDVYGDDWSVSGAEGVTSVAVLRDQATSIGVDVYNMLNDVVTKKFIPALKYTDCGGISSYNVEQLQWCTLKPGKTHKVDRTLYKANNGNIGDGERVTSYENMSVEISFFCYGVRHGHQATFQFGGPSVQKCRNKVVFNGNTK